MALRKLLSSKPEGPYSKPPPLHICVVGLKDQARVLSWEFEGKPKPASIKQNAVMVISDGQSLSKVTLYEEYKSKVKEGGSYVVRGYSLRGQSPPYIFNILKDTVFFRSSAIKITPELEKQAEALLNPCSPLTPISTCKESTGLVTVEGEVVEMSAVKKVVVGRDTVPLLNITIKQGETEVPVCLWREVALTDFTIGTQVQMSHLTGSEYGFRLQSTAFTKIEVPTSTPVRVVGAMGVVDVEGSPGDLQVLLDDNTTLNIREDKWGPIEAKMLNPPIRVEITVVGGYIETIEAV
ncbi:hypothetical protein VZT92_005800 [Zoarces viviparus]|uniref:Uncharacterized protein n=1 Tax=Zoarces viviparus TaxID=48416 RepID=A0AAW1FMM7_ZOAVI